MSRDAGRPAADRPLHEVIVVGVDGSPGGYAAVAEAAELARRFRARLIGLSVEEGLPRYAATMGEVDEFKREKDRYFAEVGERAARVAGRHGSAMEHEVRIGHAADVLVRFVEEVGGRPGGARVQGPLAHRPIRHRHHGAEGGRLLGRLGPDREAPAAGSGSSGPGPASASRGEGSQGNRLFPGTPPRRIANVQLHPKLFPASIAPRSASAGRLDTEPALALSHRTIEACGSTARRWIPPWP